ncbi:MAG: Smr/MutS family protein [Saprospiraceae bacterium]|nr:Smr/MutS family protein [Saprospiraceae bacterium]
MSKLFGIGTKVKFLTTPDSGVIIEKLGDGMVMVKLDDFDMDIPAFEEDLVRFEDFMGPNISIPTLPKKEKAIVSNTASSTNTPLPLGSSMNSTKPVFTNSGVHIAFEPVIKKGGEIEKFTIFLINDTAVDIVFALDFILFGDIEWSKDGILKAVQFETLGELPFDRVNDLPELDVTIKPIFTEGVGNEIFKTLKIKPKQFVKNYQWLKFFNREVHLFLVSDDLTQENTATKEDLTKYTKDIIKTQKQKSKGESDYRLFDHTPNLNEYAAFVPEIDLHIEMLHESPRDLTNDEIVRTQIRAFETFLAKAIRLNVPRIHVIHGLGKGRLRDMIAARLRRHPDVFTFKNEYHEKYGFGATEIWLR